MIASPVTILQTATLCWTHVNCAWVQFRFTVPNGVTVNVSFAGDANVTLDAGAHPGIPVVDGQVVSFMATNPAALGDVYCIADGAGAKCITQYYSK